MASFAKIRRSLESQLKRRLAPLGFVKQSKDYSHCYLSIDPTGYHGVSFSVDDRYDVTVRMMLMLRFEKIAKSHDLINQELLLSGKMAWITPELVEDGRALRHSFICSYEVLAGLGHFEPEAVSPPITTEAEVPALCDRCLDLFNQYGPPYFAKFNSLDAIVRIVQTDDADWKYLADDNRGGFLVKGAAVMHAVFGHQALLDYVNKRGRELIGMYADNVDLLVAASHRLEKLRGQS